ncbi:MAG: LamG domain-containing protein [Verrucomicrobiae bacterium]|nr:LamG domain-containing protein [Verrucomicrobiae bacterium]
MRSDPLKIRSGRFWAAGLMAAAALTASNASGATLADGLVSYWPLDDVVGTKTPDLVSGYDMELQNLTAADLVEGRVGRAFQFDNARQTLLRRVNSPGEQLPINQHPAFTIAFWAKVNGTGLNDLRLFSEGSTTDNNPLFNLGTHSGGANGQLDLFFRQTGFTTVDHIRSEGEPLDGEWHHIVFVQEEDGARALYFDGIRDPLEILAKEPGEWLVNTTTIGGILRANPTHWLTGVMDDVVLWSRALTPAEIQQVATEGLVSVFPPLTRGLVAYWPLDEVIGSKTPDLASGYDMELQNLSAADLIDGRIGKAFQFDNARQTLLRRVNSPGELLPINQHPALTISFWAKVDGMGLNDLRLFSEGSTTDNNPLFNLGTHSGGANGQLDLFFRQTGFTTVDHLRSEGEPLDGEWRHIVFVQEEDGARALYFDGVRDPLEIPAKEPGAWLLNTTTIGGILRANPTHWLTGAMDDVALWSRALSEAEVQTVYTSGTPVPFSKPQPLAIRSFAADLPAVAVGDPVTLRWDVTSNVDVEIDQGVGNVTAMTIAGLGSTTVTLDVSRTFTLTLRRGTETLSQSLQVAAIANVASGWTLIENFDRYPVGLLNGNGGWFDLVANGLSVVERNGNHLLSPDRAEVAAVLPLRDLTISEGQQRTLFFRVFTTEQVGEAIRTLVGVTDRRLRFGGDVNNNIGPAAIISDEWGIGPMVGAVFGFQSPVDFYDPVLDELTPYNVWIDIVNGPFPADQSSTGDTFTIHVQRDGGPARTTILENYVSDRDPIGQADIGFTGRHLDSLVIGGRAAHSTTRTVLFDDVYLSKSGFNATVPRAFGYSEPVMPSTPAGLTVQRVGAEIDIAWTGGTLESAPAINGPWTPVAGAATSPYRTTAEGAQRYYRSRQ